MKGDEERSAIAAGSAPSGIADDPELLGDFILESREHLNGIEQNVLTLDQDPSNAEAIHACFRAFHTIKGLAGFLELGAVQEVAHEVETVLDQARNGRLAIHSGVIDRMLESKDYLNVWLDQLEAMLQKGTRISAPGNGGLLASIRALTAERPPEVAEAPAVTESVARLAEAVAAPEQGAGETPPPPGGGAQKAETHGHETRAIKVDTAKLDYLVDMVGEMVIAQSLVRHDPELAGESRPRLMRNLSQLSRITDEVQRTAMSMRMVPVGQLFQKMSRRVRDLARRTGKHAELETFGEDTELDRNIVEQLADPLMHMVRNSIDHGIEAPAERGAAGKPARARITLRASHQAGHIVIEVADDGKGLNREKILQRAIERGLVQPDAQLNEHDLFHLIFQPGFSTAEQVTDVSGRGVGMDVVRRQIHKLRGRIDIHSTPGEGTTFLLKVPLTLAIIDGLVVTVGSERYIVPIFAVREMLRPTADMMFTVQGRAEMALVRESLLPMIRLHRRFGVRPASEDPGQCLLIVSEGAGRRFCLMVDTLLGKQEVVIKSMGEMLQGLEGVAGGAILGDGRVGLILDLEALGGECRDTARS